MKYLFIFINNIILLGLGLQSGQFRRIIKTASHIWQRMGKDLSSGHILVSHLRLYKTHEPPYDESYELGYDIPLKWWETIEPEPNYLQELALKVLAIIPNSASCERNFSLLSWLTNNKRLQLKVENLESIAKMCCFYNTNSKKELPYFSASMTENQVSQILQEVNGQILEEEEDIIDYEDLLQPTIDRSSSNTRSATALNLFLESCLQLDKSNFNEDLEYTLDDNEDFSDSEKNSKEVELDNVINEGEGVGIYNWNSDDLICSEDD